MLLGFKKVKKVFLEKGGLGGGDKFIGRRKTSENKDTGGGRNRVSS